MIRSLFKVSIFVFVNVLLFSCSKKTNPVTMPSPSYDIIEDVEITSSEEKAIDPIPKTPPRPYVLVSFQKIGCHGKCPDFEFVLMSNGEATYHGKKHTEKIGQYFSQANAGILFNIQSKIKEIDFFQFEKTYPENGKIIKELPDTYILVNFDRKQLIVRNNHGAPKSLLDFQNFIENIMEQLEWQKKEG